MSESTPVMFSTFQKEEVQSAAADGTQPVRQRKKKGSLAAELDPLLTPRLAPGQPGRPKGSANHEWTPEADRTLIELFEKWGPTKAKQIMCRKLQELGLVDGVARPDTLRKAVEHRMSKLGLPTGHPRKTPAGRTAKRWTEAQITVLLGALGADATIESVAARTGHTVKSVHAKLARLDYQVHEVSGFAVFTVDQLSALLQVTPRQVRRWKEKGLLETKDRRVTERDLGQFLREHAGGIPFESLPRETQIYLVDLGYRCQFIKAQDLFDEMYASLADRSTRQLLNRLARLDVLLIYEFGYLNLKPEQSNIFFKLMEERYRRRPTIITTNLVYDEWPNFLGNRPMVEALLSRLRHYCHTVVIDGPPLREPQG